MITTSETLKEFLPAFLKAQQAVGHALKNSLNPHHKSKYANLEEVIDTIKGPLNDNKIIFTQHPTGSGLEIRVTTRLTHSSGEFMQSEYSLPAGAKSNVAQEAGSHITYMRRYALTSILGIFQEDDDANSYHKPVQRPQQAAAPQPSAPPSQFYYEQDQPPPSPPVTLDYTTAPGDYQVTVGKKHKGKRLKDIPMGEIIGYVDWLEKDVAKSGKPLSGPAAEFVAAAHRYMQQAHVESVPPPGDGDFPIPF